MATKTFPWWGYLLLGVGALAAAGIYLVRAVAVDATVERIVSAAVFTALAVFWLVLSWLARRPVN